MTEVGWGFERGMWQPHKREQRSVSRPLSGWGSASWPQARHTGLKHPGRRAWKQQIQTQDRAAGIGIMRPEDGAYHSLLFQHAFLFLSTATGLFSIPILLPVFVALNWRNIFNVKVCDWCIMLFKTLGKACYLCQVWFPVLTMQHLLLDMLSPKGLPTLELALPHTEKGREGGKKGPLMKGLNPAPHSHSFPPSFPPLPCGVNLAKRRQQQPIYTSSSSFFLPCLLFPCLAFPHPPLSSLCLRLFGHVCVHSVCVIQHALAGGIISSTVRWKTVQPLRLATPASSKLCSWGVTAQVSPPSFTQSRAPVCHPPFLCWLPFCLHSH